MPMQANRRILLIGAWYTKAASDRSKSFLGSIVAMFPNPTDDRKSKVVKYWNTGLIWRTVWISFHSFATK